MTYEEEKDYISAKSDFLKAMRSFQKLKQKYKQQMVRELIEAEGYAAVWQAVQYMNNIQR